MRKKMSSWVSTFFYWVSLIVLILLIGVNHLTLHLTHVTLAHVDTLLRWIRHLFLPSLARNHGGNVSNHATAQCVQVRRLESPSLFLHAFLGSHGFGQEALGHAHGTLPALGIRITLHGDLAFSAILCVIRIHLLLLLRIGVGVGVALARFVGHPAGDLVGQSTKH